MAIGGALGATARYGVWLAFRSRWSAEFPWPTLAVNLIGSLLIGVVAALVLQDKMGDGAKAFWATGLLGGFTTFSAFSLETLDLLRLGRPGLAVAYAAGSVVLGVALAALGFALARQT